MRPPMEPPQPPTAPDVPGPVTRVEARGVLCPVPIIRLARAAAALPPGSVLELLTDDPAAAHDVPAWCRLRGHELLSTAAVGSGTGPDGAEGPAESGPAAGAGPEPHAPNPFSPDQSLRHRIRLAGPLAAAGSVPG